jgi:PadR family transcriptional regulator, regulatory protein AphA
MTSPVELLDASVPDACRGRYYESVPDACQVPKLTPFSYVVLTLVGNDGATAPELSAMRKRGRMYWAAPRSQWYAEPKRLAAEGLLTAEEEPGVTGPRTRYRLTAAGRAALAAWLREPASLPRIQNEAIVRVLAAELAEDPEDVRRSLDGLRAEIAVEREHMAEGREVAERLPERRDRLLANHRMTERVLDALAEWADELDGLLGPER